MSRVAGPYWRTALDVFRRVWGLGALALGLAGMTVVAGLTAGTAAEKTQMDGVPIKERHVDISREAATRLPRSERDQAYVDNWPLYRTERGQEAFNDAMATLKATDMPSPTRQSFKGCERLECNLVLPALTSDGWIPPGRLWVSPGEYVLIVNSPRPFKGNAWPRRTGRGMRYFVFHEFHNSSYNTDPYDTISSHKGAVFVPFYMTKQAVDARGRRFVIVVQVAPHDVVSIHATNMGSAGPGIEVAKNYSDVLEPLQAQAGILVATIVKAAVPRLEVVNHRGAEGRPMLDAYEDRLARLKGRAGPPVQLPFTPALPQRVAAATGSLTDLLRNIGGIDQKSPPEREAVREVVAPRPTQVWPRVLSDAPAACALGEGAASHCLNVPEPRAAVRSRN